MGKYLKRLVSLALCAVMLLGLMPSVPASAEEGATVQIDDFAQLKAAAQKTYTGLTIAIYAGTDPLVISESITLPENLSLAAMTAELVIPAGVTVTPAASTVPNLVIANKLTVAGNLTVAGVMAFEAVTVTGTLNYTAAVEILGTTQITGKDKIIAANSDAIAVVACTVENMEQLKASFARAAADTDEHWMYYCAPNTAFPISESLVIPENCVLTTEEITDGSLRVVSNAVVQVDGLLCLDKYLDIYGTVIVNNEMQINYREGGIVTTIGTGKLICIGKIVSYSSSPTPPPYGPFKDIDMKGWDYVSYTDEADSWWEITSACPHTLADFKEEVKAPTCISQGRTDHICQRCGVFYSDNHTDPSDKHTFLNDQDTTCELCGYEREVGQPVKPESPGAMFRLYNPNSGEHFYTGSAEERDGLVELGWRYEGVAWNAPLTGEPVHRVYNPNSGDHHYTTDEAEVKMLTDLGWQYEGVAWNTEADSGIPQYRLWNPNADLGSHHYTSSEEERDQLVGLGWVWEGIGWYGMR